MAPRDPDAPIRRWELHRTTTPAPVTPFWDRGTVDPRRVCLEPVVLDRIGRCSGCAPSRWRLRRRPPAPGNVPGPVGDSLYTLCSCSGLAGGVLKPAIKGKDKLVGKFAHKRVWAQECASLPVARGSGGHWPKLNMLSCISVRALGVTPISGSDSPRPGNPEAAVPDPPSSRERGTMA